MMHWPKLHVPVTEMPNDLSTDIDAVLPEDIVRILSSIDREIFGGCWHTTYGPLRPNLMDEEILQGLSRFELLVEQVLRRVINSDPSQRTNEGILFAGCGTSGRIAFMCARNFNKMLEAAGLPQCFRYIIAAGDDALVLGTEKFCSFHEDSPAQGRMALEAFEREFSSLLVVGITCGLSAPFVAGIVHHALTHPRSYNCGVVVIGFNPPELARTTPIQEWGDKTCRTVFKDMAAAIWRAQIKSLPTGGEQPVVVLTPLLGGEAITGSTRMKGATATKIIIESVCATAVHDARRDKFLLLGGKKEAPNSTSARRLRDVLRTFECSVSLLSQFRDLHLSISAAAAVAATAVKAKKRIVYAGFGNDGAAGAVGIIDASEMVDTFGCDEDEWRAHVFGGWDVLRNQHGDRGASGNQLLMVDTSCVELWLRRGDVLVFLELSDQKIEETAKAEASRLLQLARTVSASVFHFRVGRFSDMLLASRKPDVCVSLPPVVEPVLSLKDGNSFIDPAAELVLKMAVNAFSTATQVLRGAVYTNRMINPIISTNKLFWRAADVVQLFTEKNSDPLVPIDSLLQAIYRSDDMKAQSAAFDPPLEFHVQVARTRRFVLPLAVLLASRSVSSVFEAENRLLKSTTLRHALGFSEDSHVSDRHEAILRHPFMVCMRTPFKVHLAGYTVRNARPGDLAGAYYVCLKTGNFGDDGESFYEDDPDALGRRFAGPYIMLEPELALVLEDESTGEVAGYALGAFDSKAFYDKYERLWRPALTAAFPHPTGDSSKWTRAQWMHWVYHHPEYYCPSPYEKYPAHMHVNLLRRAQGAGIGRLMLEELMARMRQRGAKGVHLEVSINNDKAMGFYRRLGFHEIERVGEPPDGSIFIGVTFENRASL